MIRVINKLEIKKGHVEEVLERFSQPKAVHTFSGFIFMEVLEKQNVDSHDELHIATTWEDETAFENWRLSRKNDKVHGQKDEKTTSKAESPIINFEVSIYDIRYRHLPEGR